jgi:hypothetical protein
MPCRILAILTFENGVTHRVMIIMIVLQFDSAYHRWAMLLLRSLAVFEREERVLCDTVGLDEGQLQELEGSHPRTICVNSPRPSEMRRADMANRKPFVLRNAMDRFPEERWFCLLDADMLVRRRLDHLWRLVDDASAALIFTNGIWNGQFYARLVTVASVVLVRRDGRDLVERWARLYDHDAPVDQVSPREWFWDQVTLFLAWCESPLPIATISISEFANVQLDGRAAIWAANVPDKERYLHYFQAESSRQRASSEEGAEAMRRHPP